MKLRDLKALPSSMDDLEVFMAERKTEFKYGLVNSATEVEINFSEEPNGEVIARGMVLILDEE